MRILRFLSAIFYLFLLLAITYPAFAQSLLPPEQAFAAKVFRYGNYAELELNIADNYYLYKSSIHISSIPQGIIKTITLPFGKEKTDKFLGKQLIYSGSIRIPIYLNHAPNKFTLTAQVRGCAEVAKVCYLPYTHVLSVSETGTNKIGLFDNKNNSTTNKLFISKFAQPKNGQPVQAKQAIQIKKQSQSHKPSTQTTSTLFGYYIAGLLLAFTACMYPLIPILSSIIAGQTKLGRRRGFLLSLSYTQGLALTYSLVGIAAASSGTLLTVWLQRPIFIIFSAILMLMLALAMFGFWNLQLPSAMQSKLASYSNKLSGGKYLSVFMMGVISALIIGPCVAPPLVFAIAYIASSGNIFFGGLSLYIMALGLGTPLLVVGYFGGGILPKAGTWMLLIKNILGFVMLALAIQLVAPLISTQIYFSFFAILALLAGIILINSKINKIKLPHKIGKTTGIIFILIAILIAAYPYNSTIKTYLFGRQEKPSLSIKFRSVASVKELQKILLANKNKQLIVVFYADWCVECKKLDRETFNNIQVKQAMQKFILLRVDVTKNTKAQQNLSKHFHLFGPPAIVLMRTNGAIYERIIGFISAEEFKAKLLTKFTKSNIQ